MKITNRAVPPELQQLADSLISETKAGQGMGTQARTRRGSRLSPNLKSKTTDYSDITAAVEELIIRQGTPPGSADFNAKVRAEIKEIEAGNWNPAYWMACEILSTDYLGNVPASAADPAPPPYGYRDAANMPTLPTYGAGAPDIAPARYTGARSGSLFLDTLLVWQRTIYKLAEPIKQDKKEPAIISYDGTLTVATDKRGSRPMLSIIMRLFLTDQTGGALGSTANPTDGVPPSAPATVKGCLSLYWRYILPSTSAPFFNTTRLRRIVRNLAKSATIDAAGDMDRAVIITAPRPMFGRGFNNNNTVNTTLAGSPEIYQINKPVNFNAQLHPTIDTRDVWNEYLLTINGKPILVRSFSSRVDAGDYNSPEGFTIDWYIEAIAYLPFYEFTFVKESGRRRLKAGGFDQYDFINSSKLQGVLTSDMLTEKYTFSLGIINVVNFPIPGIIPAIREDFEKPFSGNRIKTGEATPMGIYPLSQSVSAATLDLY